MAAVVDSVSRYRWVILGLAVLAQWSNAMANQSLAPLAPLFLPELGLTRAEVGFFSSALFVGSWCTFLLSGSITDRIGVRKMVSLGQVSVGLILLTTSVAGDFLQVLAVMFFAGLGRGAIVPSSTRAVMDWFPPSSRATAMGIKQTGVPVAGILCASILPTLGLAIGWRSAIAAVGLWLVAGGVVTALLYREAGRSDRRGPRAGALEGLRALLPNRRIWILSCTAVIFVTVQLSVVAYLALYFSEVVLVPLIADEPTRIVAAGGYLAVAQMGGVVGRVLWGVVSDRVFHGQRMLVMAIAGGLSAAMGLAMSSIGAGYPLWLLTAVVFVFGTTVIGWNGLYHALMVETAGRKYAATGVGLVMSFTQIGAVVGPPLFGFLVDVTGVYQVAWLFLVGLSLAGTLAALLGARGEKLVG